MSFFKKESDPIGGISFSTVAESDVDLSGFEPITATEFFQLSAITDTGSQQSSSGEPSQIDDILQRLQVIEQTLGI